MLRGMSARHFHEWRAFDDMEPFDETRSDVRAASIVQAIYNVRRGKRPPIKLMDCVVTFGSGGVRETPKSAEQARAEVERTMNFLCLLFNSEPEKESKPRAKRATQ